MIRSMTGYGKSQQLIANKKTIVEFRSLNSKQLDLSLRLPPELKTMEYEIRSHFADKLQRGKIELTVTIETDAGSNDLLVDEQIAMNALRQLKSLAEQLQIKLPDDILLSLMKFPGFFTTADVELPESFLEHLIELSEEAYNGFDTFRLLEGQALKTDMQPRIEQILELVNEVEKLEMQRTEGMRARIMRNLQEIADHSRFDPNRFEQEMIYYLEKLDISEEKQRLRQHCQYFTETIDEYNAGKKLNFISQEIGREINTLGSKANDASIQRLVVQMKDELEKIKEQLFNVL